MNISENFNKEHEKIKRPECLKRKFPSTSTATTSRHDYGTPSAKKPRINWYVKLAQESPEKSYVPTDDEDKYSAIHEAETDVCCDSDDTDDTAGFATIDVLEYEIATSSESDQSDDTYIGGSTASESDDMYLAALTNIAAHAFYTESSAIDTGSEYFQADTEVSEIESDSEDPELGPADYWECIKCKNKQNNPMYRYCERCYQVRKSHFPPRPKKKRTRRRRRRSNRSKSDTTLRHKTPSPILDSNDDENISDIGKNTPLKVSIRGLKRKNTDSAGDSLSSSSDSESEFTNNHHREEQKRSPKRRRFSNSTTNNFNIKDCASRKQTNLDLGNNIIEDQSCLILTSSQISDTKLVESSTISNTDKCLSYSKILSQQLTDSGISSQESNGNGSGHEQEPSLSPVMLHRINATLGTKNTSTTGYSSDPVEISNENHIKLASPLRSTSSAIMTNDNSSLSIGALKRSTSDPIRIITDAVELKRSCLSDSSETSMCIMCIDSPKGAVFVHTMKACGGCCYTCAMKAWKRYKVCPFCREKAKNVMKLFSH